MSADRRATGVWAAVIVLVVLGTTASSHASVLNLVSVTQSTGQFEAGSDGVNGYSAATIAVTTVPAGVSACTTGTQSIPLTGGTATLVLSSTSGGTHCATGDFSEELTLAFAAVIGTQTNTITITTAVGGGPLGTNSEVVALGLIGLPLPFAATVHVYVDYGSSTRPANGIEVLDLGIA